MRALVLICLIAIVFQPACLTMMALGKSEEMPLESARIEVVSADPDKIVLSWETKYRGVQTRSGELDIKPDLPGCEQIRVSVRDLRDDAQPRSEAGSETDDENPIPLDPCTVVILVTRDDQDLAIDASNSARSLGHVSVDAPRDQIWLAVVPFAATVDAVYVIPIAAIGFAAVFLVGAVLSEMPEYPDSWTWTP